MKTHRINLSWIVAMLLGGMAAITARVEADTTIFSANFDTGFDPQVSPTNVAPTISLASGVANPVVAITNGGFGGSAGALLARGTPVTDSPDSSVAYTLGALNQSTWFPAAGRVTENFLLNQAASSSYVSLFDFHYGASGGASIEYFSAGVGFNNQAIVLGHDGNFPSGYVNYTGTFPTSVMSVLGWHTATVEWSTVAAYIPGVQQETLSVYVYVDGQLGLHVANALVGAPQFLDQVRVGGWHNPSVVAWGDLNNSLVDNFLIQAVPEPSAAALLGAGALLLWRRRRA